MRPPRSGLVIAMPSEGSVPPANGPTPRQALGARIRAERAARGWTTTEFVTLLNSAANGTVPGTVDRSALYRWETGRVRPTRWLPSIAKVLGISVEELLGAGELLANSPRPGTVSAPAFATAGIGRMMGVPPFGSELPVDRRTFIGAGGVAALTPGTMLALVESLGRSPLPEEVRSEDVDHVHAAAAALKGLDGRYGGGGIVRDAAIAQLGWAVRLLDRRCTSSLRPQLLTAVGLLAVVIGAAAFDSYAHDDARKVLSLATTCAEEAGNWGLRAHALSWRSRQETWCGNLQLGLTYAELGLARADRLLPVERAWLYNACARGLAKMGRLQDTLAAVGASDDAWAHHDPGREPIPVWMNFYDHAQHHGDTGHALCDIALYGGPAKEAVTRLQTAVDGHTSNVVRSRALSRGRIATVLMATGDPEEASVVGTTALAEIGRLRSRRAADDMRVLHQLADPHQGNAAVDHLRERIVVAVTQA
ncbi:helix-turn-helix domain-containing protein [Peterkaempfera bronchialis]|uniref:helix-turn-helix domain-containing protein n=1 Tax=Peterkaempfera bronchialis TaxID=2126346 RepID=UPI003C2C9AA9